MTSVYKQRSPIEFHPFARRLLPQPLNETTYGVFLGLKYEITSRCFSVSGTSSRTLSNTLMDFLGLMFGVACEFPFCKTSDCVVLLLLLLLAIPFTCPSPPFWMSSASFTAIVVSFSPSISSLFFLSFSCILKAFACKFVTKEMAF